MWFSQKNSKTQPEINTVVTPTSREQDPPLRTGDRYPQDIYLSEDSPSTANPQARNRQAEKRSKPASKPKNSTAPLSPFQKLTRVHALSTTADGVITIALAGSIFFSISPDAARSRMVLYLILTMAPFAVVTPFLGPIIDRISGGHRAMIFVTALGRGIVAFLMVRHLDTLWLFPEAFALLVLQKGYTVAKSSIVSHYVKANANLVEANSRLAMLSSLMGFSGLGIGGLLVWIEGASWAAAGALVGYAFATVSALRLPATARELLSKKPAHSNLQYQRTIRRNLQKWVGRYGVYTRAVVLAISAMVVIRAAVGFVTFLLAFELRGSPEGLDVSGTGSAIGAVVTLAAHNISKAEYMDLMLGGPAPPPWHFGMVAVAVGLSSFIGIRCAPIMRKRIKEEMILLTSLSVGFIAALLAAVFGQLLGLVLIAAGISTATTAGKLSFDTLVQRDLPEADHGRFFARFEAHLQIAWVIGAFVPVGLPIITPLSARGGTIIVVVALGLAVTSFVLGCRSALVNRSLPHAPHRHRPPSLPVN